MFTDAEWRLVQEEAPMLAGAVIPALDFGVVAAIKETKTIIDTMSELRRTHADHALFREGSRSRRSPRSASTMTRGASCSARFARR